MEYLFRDCPEKLEKIRSEHEWNVYSSMNKLRNNLIHYKMNEIGYSSGPPIFSWVISKQNIGEYFLKPNLVQTVEDVKKLVIRIPRALGCSVIDDEQIITCDARDGCFSYILTERAAQDRNNR
jgi:hypothetical protein